MCFSATASFIAGSALCAGGMAAIYRFRYPKQSLALASIPIIFGIHQISEGFVWLGLNKVIAQHYMDIAMYFFNFIAMSFWPVFIPLSVGLHEHPRKKHYFIGFTLAGLAVSLYLLYSYTLYSTLHINVHCCNSIAYIYRVPYLYGVIDYFYVLIVVIPFLLSTNPRIRYILGPAFFSSFLVALYLQSGYDYPSIWCFLAAIISICIYYALSWKGIEPKNKR